jgi:hypothetical protein
MEQSQKIDSSFKDNILFHEDKEFVLPINKEDEINKENDRFTKYINIYPSLLGYCTYELIKEKPENKLEKKQNSIKVFNFYLKKRHKYKESLDIYKKSKFKYCMHYITNLTKKYIIKDLRKILLYNMALFFAERISMLLYKYIKKKRAMKKNQLN